MGEMMLVFKELQWNEGSALLFYKTKFYLEGHPLCRDMLILSRRRELRCHTPFRAPKYRVLGPCCRRVKPSIGKIFFKRKDRLFFFTKISCNSSKSKSHLV